MSHFQRKYSDDQREAIASARLDRGMTHRRIVELAAAGDLTAPDGTRLDPFTVPLSTVASEARRVKRQRMGKVVSQVANLPPRDAIETLRRRLVNVADSEITAEEKRTTGGRDPERLRQLARVLRELQAIPGPDAPRRPAPGHRDENGKAQGGATRGGMAGALIAAHRKGEQGSTAQDHPTHSNGHTENGQDAAPVRHPGATRGPTDGAPGSVARASVASAPVPA